MRAAWVVQGIGYLSIVAALWYIGIHRTPPATSAPSRTETPMSEHLSLRSPAFVHEERIPSKYTCDGEDMSPPLAIDHIPEGTRSLVLIVDDPDAPSGTWDHWILFNLPADYTRIGEGGTAAGLSGTNSWGTIGYGGPCPPSGEHRYLFRVHALDTILTLPEGASKADIEHAMEGHVLDKTTLMGRYARER